MLPLRIVESDREDFEQPVVELWRDDEFIGMVFWDEDTPIVQIYPDDDGDVKDLDARELMRILDVAERIVSPVADPDEFASVRTDLAAEDGDPWADEDPAIASLFGEFDGKAAHRTEDGEGFFRSEDARSFIERCDELDLAVVEMEAFDIEGASLIPRPNLSLTIRVQGPTEWGVFRPTANARALDTLTDWPHRRSLGISFVIQLPDGETIVA
jgi:hypothetical protein